LENSANTFDLSPEQRDTARLLDELLGQAIAARYEDFCRLSSGAFAIHAAKPVALHALRELNSMLRGVLAVPMGAVEILDKDFKERLESARNRLTDLKFSDGAVNEAVKRLLPGTAKTQIEKIVTQLGLASDGDIAKKWIALTNRGGAAHGRSFHRSLSVDGDFRANYQEPFDTVIRAVVVALRSRYTALMRRVEVLASSTDCRKAVKAFANEIPGAMPLQWHFFQHLKTGDWLSHLIKEGLIAEPLAPLESAGETRNFGPWPLGHYLHRMAQAPEASTRRYVIEALRLLTGSNHPAILSQGIVILAALPPTDSAALSDLAVAWMKRDVQVLHALAPNTLVKNLADANEADAALRVARELLRLWGENGRIESHYAQHMYEHHLPILMPALVVACGRDALQLAVDLLHQAETIAGRNGYSHLSMQPIAHSNGPPHDICHALLRAVREAGESLVKTRTVPLGDAVRMLTNVQGQIFVRLSLHLLAQHPALAPEEATDCLLDKGLITATWCNAEYAALAKAWYPSMTPENQAEVLRIVDAVPDENLEWWRERFEQHYGSAATADDEERFRVSCVAELLWKWRTVLSAERQEALDKAGDPDAWRWKSIAPDESPLIGTDFANKTVEEVVAFLRGWKPESEPSRQTVTALAQELRTAVVANPRVYSEAADQFATLRPIYVRRLLEGLQQAAANQNPIEWGNVLQLITFIYTKGDEELDAATLFSGDDPSWAWTRKAAGQLLVTGLRLGINGIPLEHVETVRSLVETAFASTPSTIDVEAFDDKFERQPYFTAQEASRGIAVELCILLVRWSNIHVEKDEGARRAALAADPAMVRRLDAQLGDRSSHGRIPRAIIGRYLRVLEYNDPTWLRTRMPALFPADDHGLRNAVWYAHLRDDGGPISELTPELLDCYLDEAKGLSGNSEITDGSDRHFRQKRFASYVILLMLRGIAPETLLEQFEAHASADLRRHAMWFVGNEVSRPSSEIPDDARARGLAYWERRLGAATSSTQRSDFADELGTISHWCFHGVTDELWLADQLLAMFKIGLAPRNGHGTVEWLQKLAARDIDRAVEVLGSLIHCSGVERWTYISNQGPIRSVLAEARAKGTADTVRRVGEAVSYLATVGGSEFMDLDPSVPST
jgi:hypothetical protein